MNIFTLRKFLIIILIITFVALLFGCSQKNKKPSGDQSNEKPPQSIADIEKDIDSIIDVLDKEWKPLTTSQGQGQQQSSSTQSSGQSGQGGGQSSQGGDQSGQGGSGQSGQGGSGQAGGQASGQGTQTAQIDPWAQVDKTVKDIHKKWNEYQPEAVKAGVTQDSINNFSSILNALTNDIVSKNLMNTLSNANGLYKFIPDFLSHHKDKSVDLKRLKYFTRDVMYKARYEKWDMADMSMTESKSLLPNIRTNAKEDIKPKYQSLEYSVYDLEKVVKERQKNLVQLKGNIILENIKSIAEYNKKAEQTQDQNKNK